MPEPTVVYLDRPAELIQLIDWSQLDERLPADEQAPRSDEE